MPRRASLPAKRWSNSCCSRRLPKEVPIIPIWSRRSGPRPDPHDEAARLARQAASIEALEAGRLPVDATDRLNRLKSGQAPWTSTLTAPDFAVSRRLRLTPLGQVAGSCVMHAAFYPGWLTNSWGNGDIRPFTLAITTARQTAIDRLMAEAEMLGAHGVVNCRVDVRYPEWGSGLSEFTAFGTAVAFEGQRAPTRPFMGGMSAEDTLALFRAGYIPLTLSFSTTAYYVMTTWQASYSESSWTNQEVPDFSRAVYEARDFVVGGLRAQAREVAADGVLGAEWHMTVDEIDVERPAMGGWGGGYGSGYGMSYGTMQSFRDHIVHLTVVGTAVGRLDGKHLLPAIRPAVNLADHPLDIDPGPLEPGETLANSEAPPEQP